MIFKRVLDLEQGDNIEEHLNNLTGQTVKMDYNIDDAERFIAVSIQLVKLTDEQCLMKVTSCTRYMLEMLTHS